MGIFTRRHPAIARWELAPHVDGYLTCEGYLMEDDGCESGEAYGAAFRLAGVPDATLVIWAYAVPRSGDPDDGFIVGYRVDRMVDLGGDSEPWVWTTYDADDDWSEWYPDAEAAAEAARHDAALFAERGPSAVEVDIAPEATAEWFGWDGEPA